MKKILLFWTLWITGCIGADHDPIQESGHTKTSLSSIVNPVTETEDTLKEDTNPRRKKEKHSSSRRKREKKSPKKRVTNSDSTPVTTVDREIEEKLSEAENDEERIPDGSLSTNTPPIVEAPPHLEGEAEEDMDSTEISSPIAQDGDKPSLDDDDEMIESCACEKSYHECASCCWNISGGWWSFLGFGAGQSSTILQAIAASAQSNPGTFDDGTLRAFLLSSAILNQASSSAHAMQAYAHQAAKDRAHLANRIRVVTKKLTQPIAVKSFVSSRFKGTSSQDNDQIESTRWDGCIKNYNRTAGGFWRITGGWFSVVGFTLGECALFLQVVSAINGRDTQLLIWSTVLTQLSTFFHVLGLYAYKTANERTKKAESIKIDPIDQV